MKKVIHYTMLTLKVYLIYLASWIYLIVEFNNDDSNTPYEGFGAPDGFWYIPVIVLQYLIIYPIWIYIMKNIIWKVLDEELNKL
jgi:hypothetical protein